MRYWVYCAILAASLAPAQTPKKAWTPPRTADGQPDFQGIWHTATLTPLERPAEFAGKEFLTEQEAAEYEKRTLDRINTDHRSSDPARDLGGHYNEVWRDRGTGVVPSRRTSLIVDPPDGRIPPFTPEGRKRRDAQLAAERAAAGPEDLPLRLRCITRGLPMDPTPNNNFLQIVQGPGYVTLLQEMMYEARIIPLSTGPLSAGPLNARPHLPPAIRAYMGDSRGHWEGDTLVIDTTNIIGKDHFHGADDNMHLTERLTRTGPDTVLYRFTVDDPTAFTKPWSGEIPMIKTDEAIFDFECHEGNYSLPGILAGARAAEKASAGK